MNRPTAMSGRGSGPARRWIQRGVSVVAVAVALGSCASEPPPENAAPAAIGDVGRWTGDSVVQTRYGEVQGYRDADRTWVWRAIPYAAPPVGDLRWRAPQDPVSWNGIRSGLTFNAGCTRFLMPDSRMIVGSEDCLYLNLWRPRTPEQRLPVYVWIHGGGNSSGSSTELPAYLGNRLADRSKMVFVSVDYRLGPFGWFAEPALRDGVDAADASGNYGTLDIIQALRWIHDNISAFGGDPRCVTIAGQSAGASDVLSLLLSPLATGLFQRAIYESGVPISAPLETAEARSLQMLASLLLRDRSARSFAEAEQLAAGMSPEDIRTYLRSKSDREILDCYTANSAGLIDNPSPLLDGYVLPTQGYRLLRTGDYPNKVPLILGSNHDEVTLFLMYARIQTDSDRYAAAARWGSELWQAMGIDAVARELAAAPGQPPVYVYRFDWGSADAKGKSVEPGDWGRRLGAFHGLEIPFLLGQDRLQDFVDPLIFTWGNAAGRQTLSRAMMGYASRFARTGNPNAPGSRAPPWLPWTDEPRSPKFMVFDARGGTPSLSMSSAELTREGVMRSLQEEVPQPLLRDVQSLLAMVRGELE